MRGIVLKEAYFIALLLRTNKWQRRALLQTITKKQLRALIEVAYNVLHGYGHTAEKDMPCLKRYQSIIRRLVAKGLSTRKRKDLLTKYISIISKLLKGIEKNIVIQWRES